MTIFWEDIRFLCDEGTLCHLLRSSLPAAIKDHELEMQGGLLMFSAKEIDIHSLKIQNGAVMCAANAVVSASSNNLQLSGQLEAEGKLLIQLASEQLLPDIKIDRLTFSTLDRSRWKGLPIPKKMLNLLVSLFQSRLQKVLERRAALALSRAGLAHFLLPKVKLAMSSYLNIRSFFPRITHLKLDKEQVELCSSLAINASDQGNQSRASLGWQDLNLLLLNLLHTINERIRKDHLEIQHMHTYGNAGRLGITLELEGAINATVNVLLDLRLDSTTQTVHLLDAKIQLPTKSRLGKRIGLNLARGMLLKRITDQFPLHLKSLLVDFVNQHRIHPLLILVIDKVRLTSINVASEGLDVAFDGRLEIVATTVAKS